MPALVFPGFLRFLGFLGLPQKFIHSVFNVANLGKLIKVAPSEECFVVILCVENASLGSFTDLIVVVVGLDDYDI